MAFDGIVTKAICAELSDLSGARIDKIFQPNKNNIVLGMYKDGKNYALNICIDSSNCRIHLTTHPNPNPQIAPNFCMVLRKNLIGLHLKNIFTLELERLVIMEFEGFDDVDDILNKKLIVELLGKHSNVILLDDQNIIIDSLRHIKHDIIDEYSESNNINPNNLRDIIPHIRYTYPTSNKYNFLEISEFETFNKLIYTEENLKLDTTIPSLFNGFSKSFVSNTIKSIQEKGDCKILSLTTSDLKTEYSINCIRQLYDKIKSIIANIDSENLSISNIYEEGKLKDYYICISSNPSYSPFQLNFLIDDFYHQKETSENLRNYRNMLLKMILNNLQKYDRRLSNINNKLKDCENMETYRIYGELITSNLYRFDANSNLDFIYVENYYDNQNELKIPLDKHFSLNQNAKRYFKKYSKLKNALEIVGIQKKETEAELDYMQSVVYELESASSIEEIAEIYDEITENVIFQDNSSNSTSLKINSQNNSYNILRTNKNNQFKARKSNLTKNKNASFNPVKYTVDGYTILIGRNNKENDWLTLKYANKSDIWFHVKDYHGSHTILKFLGEKNATTLATNKGDTNILDLIPNELIEKTAKLAAKHSKAKNSSNVPVDYCEVRYVKKPSGSKPGMVIYTNYRTIYINS